MDKIALWMVFLLVLSVGGCSSSGSGTTQSGGGSTNASSSQQKIVFAGGSTIARGDWSSYFGIPIDNRGVGGMESWQLVDSIDGYVASKPNKIFISIGMNNILNRHEGVLVNNISTIIDKIRTASPATKIYIMSMLPVKDTFSCALIEIYNNQIESLCHSKNVTFISVYSLFKTSTGINEAYYQADSLHLNADGYQVLANAIRSYVLS